MLDLFSLQLCLLFFLKTMKLYKDICSARISRALAKNFFLTDWHHRRLENTIDLLLFYREHFYGFSESDKGRFFHAKSRSCDNKFHATKFIYFCITAVCYVKTESNDRCNKIRFVLVWCMLCPFEHREPHHPRLNHNVP